MTLHGEGSDAGSADIELRETAARYGVEPTRVALLLDAASYLPEEGMRVIDAMATLSARHGTRASVWFRGVARALDGAFAVDTEEDAWALADAPLDPAEAAEAMVVEEVGQDERRSALLRICSSAADAARRTGRSRQALERLRRQGRALALRVGSQWRYPRFQLSADAPGGVVPGLDRVLPALGLSPVGAAWWLSQAHDALDGRAPIDLLHAGQVDRVAELAAAAGHVP